MASFGVAAMAAAAATPVDPDDPSRGYVGLRIGDRFLTRKRSIAIAQFSRPWLAHLENQNKAESL